MGLLDWFKSNKKAPPSSSSGLTRPPDVTRPFGRTQHPPGHTPAPTAAVSANAGREQKKNARYMRRELLYGIVRESMIRSGVLSAGYKFKALALDPRGLQFIVMVDLATEFGGNPDRWGEIEALIAQSAKNRHGVVVSAVYWRLTDQLTLTKTAGVGGAPLPSENVAHPPLHPNLQHSGLATGNSAPPPSSMAQAATVGLAAGAIGAAAAAAAQQAARSAAPARPPTPDHRSAPPISRPMPLFPEGSDDDTDAALDLSLDHPATERTQAMQPGSGRFEPIAVDEVEAFKRALAAGAGPLRAQPAVQRAAPTVQTRAPVKPPAAPAASGNNVMLLTGFEDTEAVDPDFAPPALGTTQYGELR